MSIKFKLISSVVLLALALLVTTAVAFSGLAALAERTRTIVVDRVGPMAQLKTVADMYAVNIVDTAHKIRSGALTWDEGGKGIQTALQTIDAQWKSYEATYLTDEEKLLAANFVDARAKSTAGVNELLDIVGKKDQAALDGFVSKKLYPTIDPIAGPVSALIALQLSVAQQEFDASLAEKQSLSLWMGIIAALSIVIVGVSIRIVIGGVAGPLKRIQDCMHRLAAGELNLSIFGAERKDEIGAMSAAVEIFRKAAVSNKRLEDEARDNRLKAEAERIATQEKAEADAAERLRIATSGLAGGLRRLAAGDLSFELTEAFAPDFEALRHDFNASVRQLGETLTAIAAGTQSIDSGTSEISQGASDLSRRSERQAASLEETAAALDQITANVSSASKKADEARHVAAEANASATKSGQIVASAVDAMRRIEQSSSQIRTSSASSTRSPSRPICWH